MRVSVCIPIEFSSIPFKFPWLITVSPSFRYNASVLSPILMFPVFSILDPAPLPLIPAALSPTLILPELYTLAPFLAYIPVEVSCKFIFPSFTTSNPV